MSASGAPALTPTATRWAWGQCRSRHLVAPLRLTLLAAARDLDAAAERAGRDMFAPGVLALAVTGFDGADLADDVGVTERTAVLYCRQLAAIGLLRQVDGRRFTLPRAAWAQAADPT